MSPTIPGDIPGLLQRGSLVLVRDHEVHDRAFGGVVLAIVGGDPFIAITDGPAKLVHLPIRIVALDLSDATSRAHAAWWVWLPANAIIPPDRLVGEQVDYAAAMGATGLSWCEACYSAGLGTRGEILDAVSFAREGRPMTADQIDRLRRVVLHVAGRPL